MNDKNLQVLVNIIGAVESGGQVYGKRRYNQYSPPYHSTPKEHTITIGWPCCYGHEGRQLMQAIYDADPAGFKKLDTCSPSIQSMLNKDWEAIRWNPSSKQKAVIISIIDSKTGHECQDKLFRDKMIKLVADCKADYPGADIKAQMMYCEIRHLGGRKPVNRIFDRCKGDYNLDRIMASLVKDQQDTSSNNQVGDKIFWSRHVKCRQWADEYAVAEDGGKDKEKMTEKEAIDKLIAVAEAEVGYKEKASASNLYDKTANAGSNNYTKYGYEMHKIQPRNMDYPEAWCDCFVDWCMKTAFGVDAARKVLCGDFDDYTVNSASYYKKAGRWYTTPKRGDQAFFKNSQRICHTGIVYKVSGNTVYTIEGNSGNQVRKKQYTLGDSYIAGFGRPLWSAVADVTPDPTPEPEADLSAKVKAMQTFINANYNYILASAGLEALVVDGDYGPKTRAGALAVWKHMANKYYGSRLTLSNRNFFEACTRIAEKITDAEIAKHETLKEIKNGVLAGRGYDTVKAFQTARKLTPADGKMSAQTWSALFN